MELASNVNGTTPRGVLVRAAQDFYLGQSVLTLALCGLVASLVTFLAYLSYAPTINKKAPKFTSDTAFFIGSWGFYKRRWSFFKDSATRSKTGHFSFWLGKIHVVGVSGEAARKQFLDHPSLDRVTAAHLHGIGPEIVPPLHPIFTSNSIKEHSYFQRRVLDLMQTEHLALLLSRVARDARNAFEELANDPTGMTSPIDSCYRLALTQAGRLMCCNALADNPALFNTYAKQMWTLQHTTSGHTVAVPWLPSWSHMKRRYCRYRLNGLLTPIVNARLEPGAARADDALQHLIDSGDSADEMVTFFISALFIAVANAGKVSGTLLNIICLHPDWQEKMYDEVKAAAQAHATNKDAPLVEQLGTLPLDAWERSFPFIQRSFQETIRMHVSFPMIRQNVSTIALPIPGSDEVIPSGSFVAYHTSDVHHSDDLYPKPTELDPERFNPERQLKKETYSYLGWGNGRHRCVGQRWAKLQQNMTLAYALAMYEWVTCDAEGGPIPAAGHDMDLDTHGNSLPRGVFCKYVPRKN